MSNTNRVRELREKNGVLQEKMADLLGISIPNYSKKETGAVRFSLTEAKIISTFFRVPVDEIFFNQKVSKIETKQEGVSLQETKQPVTTNVFRQRNQKDKEVKSE